jgi:hypothetical protein
MQCRKQSCLCPFTFCLGLCLDFRQASRLNLNNKKTYYTLYHGTTGDYVFGMSGNGKIKLTRDWDARVSRLAACMYLRAAGVHPQHMLQRAIPRGPLRGRAGRREAGIGRGSAGDLAPHDGETSICCIAVS